MPNLDLSTATAVRFGNTNALAVRIANVDVWTKPLVWVEDSTVYSYGWETNRPDSWTADSGTTAAGANSAGNARTGTYFLLSRRNASPWTNTAYARRDFSSLTIGAWYEVSAWHRTNSNSTAYSRNARIGVNGIGESASGVTPTTSYQQVSYRFQATATTHTVYLAHDAVGSHSNDTNIRIFWDDVLLVAGHYE